MHGSQTHIRPTGLTRLTVCCMRQSRSGGSIETKSTLHNQDKLSNSSTHPPQWREIPHLFRRIERQELLPVCPPIREYPEVKVEYSTDSEVNDRDLIRRSMMHDGGVVSGGHLAQDLLHHTPPRTPNIPANSQRVTISYSILRHPSENP